MAKAVHTMIRVFDEARSTAFYKDVFGLDVVNRYPFDGFTLTYLGNAENDFEVELTINHDRTEPYAHADGYGHLAVVVVDLEAEHARVTSLGHTPGDIKEFNREGALFAKFFFITDPDGYKIEVIQRHGRYQ
jgi:lactoylglutathione lyase